MELFNFDESFIAKQAKLQAREAKDYSICQWVFTPKGTRKATRDETFSCVSDMDWHWE